MSDRKKPQPKTKVRLGDLKKPAVEEERLELREVNRKYWLEEKPIVEEPKPVERKGGPRCTGHCCRAFSIPYAPEDLHNLQRLGTSDKERLQIADMVIYLGHFYSNPVLRTRGESWTEKALQMARNDKVKLPEMEMESGEYIPRGRPFDDRMHWYACRHVQLNGDCGIYDRRPNMCRVYPNGARCSFAECTWDPDEQRVHNEKLISERRLLRKTRGYEGEEQTLSAAVGT
jgi:Fe-S-cluster containining protein